MDNGNVEPKRELVGTLAEDKMKDFKILVLEQQNVELKINTFRNELVTIQSRVQMLQRAGGEAAHKLDVIITDLAKDNNLDKKEITVNPDTGEIFKTILPAIPEPPSDSTKPVKEDKKSSKK